MKNAISLIIVLTGCISPVFAQQTKIGFVQPEYVLSLLPEAQAAQQDIDAFERKLTNKLTALQQGLQLQALQLQRDSTLSDSLRAERERELQLLQQDIRKEQQTAQSQLQFKEIQTLSPLEQKVQQTIDSVAAANAYTHIFPSYINGQPLLRYVKDPQEADMTPLVLKALGITAPADTTGR